MWLCSFYYGLFHVKTCLVFCFSRIFPLLLSIMITSLGEKRAGLCASREFVRLSSMRCFLSFSLFVLGLAADCDFGTPWTFYLTFF